MVTNPEKLDSGMDSELLNIQNDTKNWLTALKKMIGFEKKSDSWTTEVKEDNWTKTEVFEYKWAIGFNYNQESGGKRQILTRKEWNTYKVRVKKWAQFPNWEDWQTQKFDGKETFDFEASNRKQFNVELWKALDKIIEDRQRLPKTGKTVYDMLNQGSSSIEHNETQRKTDLRKKPIDLRFEEKNKEQNYKLDYPQNYRSVEWRITRCLRFQAITDAAEDRYWIPRWLLMAMMAQEWWWDPTVINQRSSKNANKTCDGWAGLIHIQAANAAHYWLKTLPRSTSAMVDYEHWEKLEAAKRENKNNLAKLSELDDRFNPVLSVDVAARYIMDYCGWKNKTTWEQWMDAICKYAWRWLQDYGYAVLVYWTTINKIRWNNLPSFKDKEINKVIKWEGSAMINWQRERTDLCIKRTQNAMNNLHPKLDGEEASLGDYYAYQKSQWDNYGLQQYIDFNKEHPYVK